MFATSNVRASSESALSRFVFYPFHRYPTMIYLLYYAFLPALNDGVPCCLQVRHEEGNRLRDARVLIISGRITAAPTGYAKGGGRG